MYKDVKIHVATKFVDKFYYYVKDKKQNTQLGDSQPYKP